MSCFEMQKGEFHETVIDTRNNLGNVGGRGFGWR
jgi:hypothetical protein